MLDNLFGVAMPTVAAAQPVASASSIPQPEAAELPTPATDSETVDADEVLDFDSLPLPGRPCPVCGSLETWWDILGGEHCQQCGGETLDKALKLAEKAARLRSASLPTPKMAAA